MDPASPALAPDPWQDDFNNDTQALIDVGGAHISADVLEDNSDATSESDGQTDDEAINEAIGDTDRLRVNEADHAEDHDGGNNNDYANRTL